MTLFISNPSRGGAAPSTPGDPVGTKALDPIRVSLRETSSYINLSTVQLNVGYAKSHALGVNGPFERQLPRTRRGSLFNPAEYTDNPTISVVGNALNILKTAGTPQASTYFTSVDRGALTSLSAMFTSVFSVGHSPVYSGSDPVGPVIGLEHGPRNTAAYCFFLDDGTTKKIRVCGPNVNGTRSPDVYVTFDWSAVTDRQYIIFWNEARQILELWTDDLTGSGGIGNATLITAVSLAQFQQFGGVGSVPAGGANDITGVYGVEGASTAAAAIVSVATSADVSFPFVNGNMAGGWKTFLDSDVSVGFSGSVDPTHLGRGGIWFPNQTNLDPAGQIIPSSGGYCRFEKNTASTDFSIYRDEPGFQKTVTDGFSIEFRCSTSTSGGTGFATGAAIQISDGSTLFQLDFLNDGSARNIGLLLDGGDPTVPSDHLLALAPIDYSLGTLRLTVDSRRGVMEMFNTENLDTPLATWDLDRGILPTATDSKIVVGLPVTSTPAIGALDVFSLKYSYIYQAWEARDSITPDAADPVFSTNTAGGGGGGPLNAAVMPGVLPLPYFAGSGGGGSGSGSLTPEGYEIECPGGTTFFFSRSGQFDVNRGCVLETSMKIEEWHSFDRSGVFAIIDDGDNAFMLSFVETDAGKYVCIPLSAGSGSFQEYAGPSGLGAQLSVPIDWTVFHTYRLERRPRDGLYLFIDNNPVPALVLLDSARYSFPHTQFNSQLIAFGQFTDEGAVSVWEFVRGQFGSGYEISTGLSRPAAELQARLSNARTTVVVAAAGV